MSRVVTTHCASRLMCQADLLPVKRFPALPVQFCMTVAAVQGDGLWWSVQVLRGDYSFGQQTGDIGEQQVGCVLVI